MTYNEAVNWLDSIKPFLSDEQYADYVSTIGENADDWFMVNKEAFRQFPGYRSTFSKVGVPEERLYNLIKDDKSLDYTDNEKWDLMELAGIDSEEIMNKSLDKIRKDRENDKKTKADLDKEKLAQQYRYARQKAVDEYQHSYLGMDKDNLLNQGLNWLADHVISDDTKRAMVEDPNNTSGIWANAATDIVGSGLDFAPGYWSLLGTGARVAQDIANGHNAADIIGRNWLDAAVGVGGAKLMKGMKAKGVSDDALDISEKASGFGGEAKQAVADWAKAKDKAGVAALTRYISKKEAKKIRNMSPEEWQKYIKTIKDPSTRELLKSVGYENRNKLKDIVKQLESDFDKFANNEVTRANLYWKEHPKTVKAVEIGTPVMKQSAVGLSKSTTRAGKQDTPYKTSDPNKATFKRDQDVIDWYKDNYGDQWKAGFKPRLINGELMMKAWQEGHDEGKW